MTASHNHGQDRRAGRMPDTSQPVRSERNRIGKGAGMHTNALTPVLLGGLTMVSASKTPDSHCSPIKLPTVVMPLEAGSGKWHPVRLNLNGNNQPIRRGSGRFFAHTGPGSAGHSVAAAGRCCGHRMRSPDTSRDLNRRGDRAGTFASSQSLSDLPGLTTVNLPCPLLDGGFPRTRAGRRVTAVNSGRSTARAFRDAGTEPRSRHPA